MTTKLKIFINAYIKTDLPDLRPGDTVRVYQKIPGYAKATADKTASAKATADKKEGEKVQTFEGLIIARKHGKEMGSTITVRKIIKGIGVEKIFPLHSPLIEKLEVLRRGKVRRAKLYYLRRVKGKKGKLKQKEFGQVVPEEISGGQTSAEK